MFLDLSSCRGGFWKLTPLCPESFLAGPALGEVVWSSSVPSDVRTAATCAQRILIHWRQPTVPPASLGQDFRTTYEEAHPEHPDRGWVTHGWTTQPAESPNTPGSVGAPRGRGRSQVPRDSGVPVLASASHPRASVSQQGQWASDLGRCSTKRGPRISSLHLAGALAGNAHSQAPLQTS